VDLGEEVVEHVVDQRRLARDVAAAGIGYPTLMQRAVDAVADLSDGCVTAGFSDGGGMAEHVALRRPVSGVLMLSGALPLEMLGAGAWPAGVPAQIHYAIDDPFRNQEWIDSLAAASGAEVFDYPGRGHLFTDRALPDEYDPAAAELLWERVLAFLAQLGPAS